MTEIRAARPDELDAVAELVVRAYVGGGLVAADSTYIHELRDTATRARQAELLVAVDGDRLLGTVTFCPHGSPYAELAKHGEADFRMLAVDPDARGLGVGRLLVEECLERTRAGGYAPLRLSTTLTMHAAHRLYERMGFTRTPELDWSPNPDVPLITYARKP